jgi:hypothetical protein
MCQLCASCAISRLAVAYFAMPAHRQQLCHALYEYSHTLASTLLWPWALVNGYENSSTRLHATAGHSIVSYIPVPVPRGAPGGERSCDACGGRQRRCVRRPARASRPPPAL